MNIKNSVRAQDFIHIKHTQVNPLRFTYAEALHDVNHLIKYYNKNIASSGFLV